MNEGQWAHSGWGYKPHSIDELMMSISRIGFLETGRRYVWRGVRDWHWPIRTSLQRYAARYDPHFDYRSEPYSRKLERQVLAHARYWRMDRAGTLSDQALLASLQHHGSPTRFLDVSTDPMTALWFACERAPLDERDASGALFAFDVSPDRARN